MYLAIIIFLKSQKTLEWVKVRVSFIDLFIDINASNHFLRFLIYLVIGL